MSASKNLGQVAGLFVGTSAPENISLIWYDSTPNQRCHKVYDDDKKLWVALNPQIVSLTTYSELVTNAKKNGLSIGKFYQISDKSNVLAIAITTTKVMYSDSLGNILIDDLGTNIQYHVSSDNLLIDDISGVFNTSTNKLVFSFSELSTPDINNTYVFGKIRSGNVWKLAKFALSSLLSKAVNNSLSWKDGLYFNFVSAINSILDKDGGIVSKLQFDLTVSVLNKNIKSVGKENQEIISNANKAILENTNDDSIFNKKNTRKIDIGTAPGDILKGDTLFTIISKLQRWINKFKYATGIQLSRSFKDADKQQYVNNNDSVETALGKIQYMLKHPALSYYLPEDWTDSYPKDENGDGLYWETGDLPGGGDNFDTAFAKLSNFCRNGNLAIRLSSEFAPYGVESIIEIPKKNDTLEEAFKKAVTKLEQIGNISNGRIDSKEMSVSDSSYPVTTFDLKHGVLKFNNGARAEFAKDKIVLGNSSSNYLEIDSNKFNYKINTASLIRNGVFSAAIIETTENYSGQSCALQAINSGNGRRSFDAFFQRLKVGGIVWDAYYMSGTTYSITTKNFVVFNGIRSGDIYLPSNPDDGHFIIISKSTNVNFNVHASGNDEIDTINESTKTVSMGDNANRGVMFAFIYVSGVSYNGKNSDGLWQCSRWEASWG